MPYPGVPKELTPKMDRCVSKVMKDGKSKESAIAICKTSIMSQKKRSKEEIKEAEADKRVVANKDDVVTRLIYFSQTPVKEKTLDATKEGKMLKNVEIFKAGTYRNTEFKVSALDKMVANFHYLKSLGIFTNVPVRADHPSMFGVGEVIDKVGGYIEDLRREGKKLVADFRITSQKMWDKVAEGSYISRSAEIGTYDDNEGTIYSPVLFGVAWVDIPQVEGLSPKFSYSRDNKNFELINLNALINMSEENKDVFPPEEEKVEEIKEEAKEETPVEIPAEVPAEEIKEELSKTVESLDFAKLFPAEATELASLREEKLAYKLEKRTDFLEKLVEKGKITPAQKEIEVAFVKDLTEDQFNKYKDLKESASVVVKLDKEEVELDTEEKIEEVVEKTPEEKADEFLKETK